MRIQLYKRTDLGILILVSIFILCLFIFFKPWVHGTDPTGYYSWVRSFVIDLDLDVSNEFSHFGTIIRNLSPTGYTYNEYSVGSAFLWLPFFLSVHLISRLACIIGLDVIADGYAVQYVWAVSFGSAFYAFVGLILIYRLGRKMFTRNSILLAVVAVWLSGPLLFYMYSHPIMSHANDFFAYALYLYVWHKTNQDQICRSAAIRGAVAGFCALIRLQNAIFVLIPLCGYLIDFIKVRRRGNIFTSLQSPLYGMIIFSLAWWFVFSPQIVIWKIVYGHYFVLNPYEITTGFGFNWLHPHIIDALFSSDRGLFVWMPILLFAVPGLLLLFQKDAYLTILIIGNLCIQAYLISSWSCWSGAYSFGPRLFISMLPGLILGLAATIDLFVKYKWVPYKWVVGLCTFFIAWNFILIVRYVLEDIPRAGYVSPEKLVLGQFTVFSNYFERIIQLLLLRN